MFKKVQMLALSLVLTTGFIVGCNKTDKNGEELKVTLVLDEGGVNDQSFNQSAWEGALKAQEDYNVEVSYLESHQESEYLSNIETAIDNDSDLIIGVGFKLTDTIKDAALAYPEENFAIIDGTYDEIPENVQPILFNEQEAGYSVGLIAAKTTKTNKIGFVGGMEIPSVTNFLVGFEKALKEENKDTEVLVQYANSFTDAAKGKAIANQMISKDADIIFTAGGGVNNGVYESARELGAKVIGVDMPCSYIAPDIIITSALKNVGTGVELTIKDLVEGNFKGGEPKMFDLSNGGVGFEKTDLLSDKTIEYVENKIK